MNSTVGHAVAFLLGGVTAFIYGYIYGMKRMNKHWRDEMQRAEERAAEIRGEYNGRR